MQENYFEMPAVICRELRLSLNMLNPSTSGTELIRFNIANIIVADALAPYVASTSTPMTLTM